MPSFLDTVEELFQTKDLYDVLGLDKSASDAQIKKGYYKASLKTHPDRVDESEKEPATKKFQALVKVYGVLSDKEKRAVYDEHGIVDDEDSKMDKDWYDYWRLRFQKIKVEDIEQFATTYRHTEEEKEDLKQAYLTSEGNMDVILQCVLCCTVDDEERFRTVIDAWIKAKDVPKFNVYSKESKKARQRRKAEAKAEAAEAEKALEELGGVAGDVNSLTALIQRRQTQRAEASDSFFASLEAKYAQDGKSRSKGKKRKESTRAPPSKRSRKS